MERKRLNAILMIMSIAYGTTMAVLPDNSNATDLFTIIGAAVVAIGWATSGALFVRDRSRGHE